VLARRAAVREPVGGGAALRLADAVAARAKALVDRLADLLGADIDTAELDEAADSYAQQVSEAVSSDAETAPTSRSWSTGSTSSPRRSTCRPAMRSPPS
jgi:hypothetical protein